MEVLRKDIIRTWLLTHLSLGTRGPACRVELPDVVEAILYKLKTGCQWRQPSVKQFFTDKTLTWSGVYHHFNEWLKDGTWKNLLLSVLHTHRRLLDLSSIQLDGSHTLAKNGGAAIGYQGRKAARTTNLLFLADNTGQPLAVASPQAGNHHDVFDIETSFGELCTLMEEAHISLEGLFLNADSGFDAKGLREDCFRRGIEANIAVNPRSGKRKRPKPPGLIPNSTANARQLSAPIRGWTVSKPCSCASKLVPRIGWPFIFWPLPCCCYAKSHPTTNSKQALW